MNPPKRNVWGPRRSPKLVAKPQPRPIRRPCGFCNRVRKVLGMKTL